MKDICRTPIKLTFEQKCILEKEELLNQTMLQDIQNIALHYEMLYRKVTGSLTYTALWKTDSKEHKNYNHFERVYWVCRLKDWNYSSYIESQFERAERYWKNGKIPLPSQLYSEKAITYYINVLARIGTHYDTTADKKRKTQGKITMTLEQEVLKVVKRDMSRVESTYRKNMETCKMVSLETNTNPIYVASLLTLSNSRINLSPFYLYLVPNGEEIVLEADRRVYEALKNNSTDISNLRKLIKSIHRENSQFYDLYKVPLQFS